MPDVLRLCALLVEASWVAELSVASIVSGPEGTPGVGDGGVPVSSDVSV